MSLLKLHGYKSLKPRFTDNTLEQNYRTAAFQRVHTHWVAIIKVLLALLVVLYAIHWTTNESIAGIVIAAELVLFTTILFPLFLKPEHFPKGWEFLLTSVLISVGQISALLLIKYGYKTSDAVLVIGYLTIFIGAVAPNLLGFQALAAVGSAIGFTAIIFTIDEIHGGTLSYHLGFILFTTAVAVCVSTARESSERLTFLLNIRADALLRNVLPEKIALSMKEDLNNETSMVERFEDVSVLFADLVGFTNFAATNSPEETVKMLSDVFRRFDAIAEKCKIEKIKTIGDAYMAVAGLPERCGDHAQRIANASLEMRQAFEKYCASKNIDLQLRIGLHRGPVIAGVIGTKKFLYDLWGDTVNTASRLEARCEPGQILVSEPMSLALGSSHRIAARGKVDLKGKGIVEAYILEGKEQRRAA